MKSKLFLIIYIILFVLLIIFFSKYNINDLLQSNFNKLEEIKKNYFILFIFITFIFSIVISFLGFSLPVIILNGIIHGNLFGFLNTLVSLTVGSYLFYIFYYNANPQQIYQIFKKRFKKTNEFITKKQFLSLFVLRFFGFGMPFIIHNYFGIFFKIKKKTFILASFFGMIPLSLQSIIADGLFNIIFKKQLSIIQVITEIKIILPIFILFIISIIGIFIKKKYF